jgi:hypothetical protein
VAVCCTSCQPLAKAPKKAAAKSPVKSEDKPVEAKPEPEPEVHSSAITGSGGQARHADPGQEGDHDHQARDHDPSAVRG